MTARPYVRRLLLVLLGTLLPLVLLEGVLRIAPRFLGDVRGGARGGTTTILCVGDSHTYGLHVFKPHSYPALLQAALDPTGAQIGVMNYGVPGRNSAALRSELPRYLEAVRPDLVLVLVGFNDTWNFDRAAETATDPQRPAAPAEGFLANLRIARVLRLIALNVGGRAAAPELAAPRIEERDGKMVVIENGRERPAGVGRAPLGVAGGERLIDQVGQNLRAIVAQIRAADAQPILLTYTTENQQVFVDLNANARRIAMELDVPLVALDDAFRPEIATHGYPALFFADDHPNRRGNELCARAIADRLQQLGLVTAVAGTFTAAAATRLAAIEDADRFLCFTIDGPALRDVQVVVSPVREPPVRWEGTQIPLGDDGMVAVCLESPNLSGRTDAAGRATLRVARAYLDPGQRTLYAIAAVFGPDGQPRLSEVVEIAAR